jgi:hypothetical protein
MVLVRDTLMTTITRMTLFTTTTIVDDHKTSFKLVFPDPLGSALGVLSLGFQPIWVFFEVEYNIFGGFISLRSAGSRSIPRKRVVCS